MRSLLLSLALVNFAVAGYAPLSCADQVAISNHLLEILDTSNYGNDATPGDTAAKWVRLAFHDAGTWDPYSKTGGAHACIAYKCSGYNTCERNLDANNGLEYVSDDLEYHWINGGWRNTISRPDFWTLAAKVALEWASGGAIKIRWGWGRTECSDFTAWPDRHPDAKDGFYAVKKHMVDRLGFSWEESIALLGAHSLGECHIENSGYHGRWVPYPANYFNNNFYKIMLKYNWYGQDVPCNSSYSGGCKREYVTDGLKGSLLLSTDAAMNWDVDKSLTCTLTSRSSWSRYSSRCPLEYSLQPIVKRFANDNGYWLDVFATAFERLTEFGGDNIYYNPDSDVAYDLYQTNWKGYYNWYNNARDYGVYFK